jgi:hypothetical protein
MSQWRYSNGERRDKWPFAGHGRHRLLRVVLVRKQTVSKRAAYPIALRSYLPNISGEPWKRCCINSGD